MSWDPVMPGVPNWGDAEREEMVTCSESPALLRSLGLLISAYKYITVTIRIIIAHD